MEVDNGKVVLGESGEGGSYCLGGFGDLFFRVFGGGLRVGG